MNTVQPTGIWRDVAEMLDPMAEIRRLGLERQVAELDAHGYTVVEPEQAAPPGFAAELEAAILHVAERRSGVRPDREGGKTHQNLPSGAGQHLYKLLTEGPAFEKAMMNDVAQALVSYVIGQHAVISSMTAMIKGAGKVNLDLHSDVLLMPPPYPQWASGVNATWALTDYDRENGSTCFWPGSHRFCRQPTTAERDDQSMLKPVEARAGSLLVWHSNTWHGAYARTRPGLRVNLIMFFSRPFMFRQEDYRGQITPEMVARNGPRFAQLAGDTLPFPMDVTGPDHRKLAGWNAAVQTQWG